MKELQINSTSGSELSKPAPCAISLQCSTKVISCASNVVGTTCSYVQAGFGDITPIIGVRCGNAIQNCNDDGSGSGSGSGSPGSGSGTNPTAIDPEGGLL